jgi:hypothetical protein
VACGLGFVGAWQVERCRPVFSLTLVLFWLLGCLAFLTQVVKVISLYLHSSDAAEVMNKQEQIARQLVESEFGHKSEEHKSKLITSTFRHLSTRYIDGISFTASTRGIDDTEDDIEQKF